MEACLGNAASDPETAGWLGVSQKQTREKAENQSPPPASEPQETFLWDLALNAKLKTGNRKINEPKRWSFEKSQQN